MGCRVLRRPIWGYSVCLCPIKRMPGNYRWHFNIYAKNKFHAMLSMKKVFWAQGQIEIVTENNSGIIIMQTYVVGVCGLHQRQSLVMPRNAKQ